MLYLLFLLAFTLHTSGTTVSSNSVQLLPRDSYTRLTATRTVTSFQTLTDYVTLVSTVSPTPIIPLTPNLVSRMANPEEEAILVMPSYSEAGSPTSQTSESTILQPQTVYPILVEPAATQSAAHVQSSQLVMSYYTDYTADQLPPEKVDFNRLDWVDFGELHFLKEECQRLRVSILAFAIPDPVVGLKFSQSDSAQLLDRLVASAHAKGKFVKLSIGGWGDSGYVPHCTHSHWSSDMSPPFPVTFPRS